ncbi:MAG: hypothetical protein JZU55_02615 [Afipia sp.]|nr:hypothetical protein [Afipia sp.]
MLAVDVAGEIFERAVAARTYTVADAVLDLGDLATGGSGLTFGGFSTLTLSPDLIILFCQPLFQTVALTAEFCFFCLALGKYLPVTVGTEKFYLRTPTSGHF